MDPMTILLLIALSATVLTLFMGVLSMSGSDAVVNQLSEPLMWARVGLQAVTCLLLLTTYAGLIDVTSKLKDAGIVPYNGMQPIVVEGGWRGTFYLDMPLGREPVAGQYFVFAVEARDAAGKAERRTLPLIAKNAGTMPADGQ